MYKRVLIKLSGEALGENGILFDFEQIHRVAAALKRLHDEGIQVAVVIGAGNIWRGRQGPAAKMTAINADHMGMLGTAINSIAMQDAIERLDIPTRVMSAVEMNRFCEPYTYRRAVRHLEKGRVVIFACGTGNPFFSTDTAAALRAVEIGADAILLAKNVDGVYTADPVKDPTAVKYDTISYDEVLAQHLMVMDTTATSLSMDNHIPVLLFALKDPRNIIRALCGENVGTIVKE